NSFENGIAITNTSFTSTQINIELFNLNGGSTGLHTSLKPPPPGHTARFLHETFPSINPLIKNPRIRGVGRLTPFFGPVAVMGLLAYYNERSDFLITTMPASDETVVPDSTPSIFPQVVAGGRTPVPGGNNDGYYMEFIVFSGSSGQSANGGIDFFTQNGGP